MKDEKGSETTKKEREGEKGKKGGGKREVIPKEREKMKMKVRRRKAGKRGNEGRK